MTNQVEQVSSLKLTIITISFLLISIGSFYFVGSASHELFQAITNKEDIVVFNKAFLYLSGSALIFLLFPILIIYKNIFKLDISNKSEFKLNIFLLFSVVLTFAVPHLTHAYVNIFVEENDYQLCKGKSERALYVTTLTYSKPGKCK